MFRKLLPLVLPMLLLASVGSLLVLPGCAHTGSAVSDNAVNYATSEQLYITALRTVTSLAQQGKLTLAQAERVEAARASAGNILNQWRAAVARGEPASFQASFDSALAELTRISAQAQGAN